MTNAISFPLCRLPSVACDCVVKQMRLREKYLLTKLSKRAREAVRVALLREVYTFDIRQDCDYCVISLKNNLSTRDWLHLVVIRIGSRITPDRKYPVMWTDDLGSTLAVQLELIHQVFKCSGISVNSYHYDTAFDILKRVIPVIKRLKLKILRGLIEHPYVNNDFFEFVMESFKDAETLNNCLRISPDYDWKATEPFNFRRCRIWTPITMEHVTRLFMNCRCFLLINNGHQTTAASLNGFLKKWIEGSALEYVDFTFYSMPDLRSIVDGIESEPVHRDHVGDGLEEFPDETVKIRQRSGVEALVRVYLNSYFKLTTQLNNSKSDLWSDDEDYSDEEVDDEIDEEDVDDEEEDSEEEDVDDAEENNDYGNFWTDSEEEDAVEDEEVDDEIHEDVVDEDEVEVDHEEESDYDNDNDAEDEEEENEY